MKKKLIEARELAFKNANELVKLSETENRALTKEEQETLRGYHAKIADLDSDIKTAEEQEKLEARFAVPVVHNVPKQTKEEKKAVRNYDILKTLRSVTDPTVRLDGLEKEMHDEAVKEQRESNVHGLVAGGINIPGMLVRQEQRANEQVVTPLAQGGYTVETDLMEVISILRPNTVVREAGARFLTGLKGDLAFTTQDTGANTNWKTEIAALDQASETYSQATMKPKRLGAWIPVSLQLLAQSSIDMQNFVIQDLQNAIGQSVDIAAINGTGVDPVPLGILNEAGIPTISLGANGGELNFDALVDMETAVADANAMGSFGYMLNSVLRGSLKKQRIDAGSGIMTWPVGSKELNGYPVSVGNNVPKNLTKGTSISNLSAAVFGNFNDLLVGNWAGINLVVDNVTKAKEGQVIITANTFWDVLVRRAASFVKVLDADTGIPSE